MTRPLPRDPGRRVYGNGQPWIDPEPPAPNPTCEHPETRTVQTGGIWRKQHGFIPHGTGQQCVTCGQIVKETT